MAEQTVKNKTTKNLQSVQAVKFTQVQNVTSSRERLTAVKTKLRPAQQSTHPPGPKTETPSRSLEAEAAAEEQTTEPAK